MLSKKLKAKRNPYLSATLATAGYAIGISIAKYILHSTFNLAEMLLGAAIFWIIFFLVQKWLLKRLNKK